MLGAAYAGCLVHSKYKNTKISVLFQLQNVVRLNHMHHHSPDRPGFTTPHIWIPGSWASPMDSWSRWQSPSCWTGARALGTGLGNGLPSWFASSSTLADKRSTKFGPLRSRTSARACSRVQATTAPGSSPTTSCKPSSSPWCHRYRRCSLPEYWFRSARQE